MSGTPSFSGRTYANFELNYQATVTGTGTNPVTMDTLQITDGHLNLQLRHINLKGAVIVHDTLYFNSATTCSLYFNGSNQQTMDWSAANSFMLGSATNVFVDNPAGLSLNSNMTVNCKLHLTNGNIVTGPNEVLLTTDSTIVRGNGYVQGTLWRIINTGAGIVKDYPVGNDAGYTPASLTFANVTTTGGASVAVVHNTHPGVNIASNTLQNYWTVSPTGALAFDACNAVLKYLSSDFNTGFTEADDESLMLAGKYDGGWTFPLIGVRDTVNNTIQLTGLTEFSDFTMGKDSISFIIPPDTTTPAITGTSPADGATGVALDAQIWIAFSEPMDTTSLAGSITPSPNEQPVWNASMDTLFLPHDPMAVNTVYTVKLTTINDLAGNPLAVLPDSIVFTTVVDTTHPLIVWTSPANGDTRVALGAPVIVAFSEPIDTSSFAGTVAPFVNGLNQVWNAGGDTLSLVHTVEDFALNTVYTVKVTAASDIYGIPLAVLPDSIMFATKADTAAPRIVYTSPADGDSNVPCNQPVKLAFSEPIDPASFNGYSLPDCNFNPSWNATFDTLTLTPDTLYGYSTTITMSCTTGTDTSGNRIADLPVTFTFTTVTNLGPAITMVEQPQDTYDGSGPFLVRAVITDAAKAGITADTLWYSDSKTNWWAVTHTTIDGDTFNFSIPGPFTSGTTIEYFIGAWDDGGAAQYDPGMYRGYQFRILSPLAPDSLSAVAGDMQVQLDWIPPVEIIDYSVGNGTGIFLSAGDISDTRFTPQHYPCKLEQAASSWWNAIGTDSVEVHVWADNGAGMPDRSVDLVTPRVVMPLDYPNYTVVDFASENLIISAGDFHIGYVIRTDNHPMPLCDGDGPGLHSIMFDTSTGSWGMIWVSDDYNDWSHQAVVSYSSYSKGLNLKPSVLQGEKTLPSLSGLKSAVLDSKKEAVYPMLTGAMALAKNISGYSIFRGNVSGGPYSLVGSTGLPQHTDYSVINNNTYYYVVRAEYSTPDTFSAWSNEVSATPAGVEGQPGAQSYSFFLSPASPNPVKNSAEFRFGLARDQQASLEIYNVLGQRVKTLINGMLEAGNHTVKWNGCDQNGRKVSSGVYVYRLITGDNTSTRRLTVIR